ncbi:phenylacetate--CoA ligase family protein [Paenibacillus sp. strain BS8-2]
MSHSPQPLMKHLHAIARFHPWYADLLEKAGISLSSGDSSDYSLLRKLPLMTAALLEQHYYTGDSRSEPELSVYRTSGTSTGIRKAIYYSPDDDLRYMSAKQCSFEQWLELMKDTEKPIRRALADLGTGHAASTALRIFANMGLEAEAISFSAPVQEHVDKLRRYQPDLLYTMPSLLESIADAWPAGSPFGVRKILLVGEMASREWQLSMAARLGLAPRDLLDTYGSIEVGAIAAYSHELGRYVLADGILGETLPAEEISDAFEPLAPNEGVLVLTSLSRQLFPVIRFVTYDVVRDFEMIVIDGVPRGTFSCIAKRIGHELKHGEKISLYDIEEAVHQVLQDAAIRVAVSNNVLKLHIRSAELLLHPAKALDVQIQVEQRIPDIGMMIQGGLLQSIEIIPADEHHPLPGGSVKAKKIYV